MHPHQVRISRAFDLFAPASRKSKCESLRVDLSTRLAIVELVIELISRPPHALQLQALECEAEVLIWVPPGAGVGAKRR